MLENHLRMFNLQSLDNQWGRGLFCFKGVSPLYIVRMCFRFSCIVPAGVPNVGRAVGLTRDKKAQKKGDKSRSLNVGMQLFDVCVLGSIWCAVIRLFCFDGGGVKSIILSVTLPLPCLFVKVRTDSTRLKCALDSLIIAPGVSVRVWRKGIMDFDQ